MSPSWRSPSRTSTGRWPELESEIDGVRQREDRDRTLLDSPATNSKQLSELQHELETLQRRQGSLEDSLLEVMERREQLQCEQSAGQSAVDGLADDWPPPARRGMRRWRRSSRPAVTGWPAVRRSARPCTPSGVRCTSASGAGALQGRRCGACRIEIDRGELSRIAAAAEDDVLRCPECGAILLRVTGLAHEGRRRGRRRFAGQSGAGRVRGGGVLGRSRRRCWPRASKPSGRATNNVAEYRGLIAGLAEAVDLGAAEVAVSMDSKLVVEQMAGRWKVKHPDLIELNREARGLASQFDHITFTWIPREKNKHADRLANEAMDAAAEVAADAG